MGKISILDIKRVKISLQIYPLEETFMLSRSPEHQESREHKCTHIEVSIRNGRQAERIVITVLIKINMT